MSKEEKKFTMKEIAEHSNEKSVWLLIDEEVFDVTQFLDEHPGGSEVILDHAGKEATEAFEDVGHSEDARELMMKYKIGKLCDEDRTVSNPDQFANKKSFSTMFILCPVGIAITAFLLYKHFVHR